MLMPLAPVTSPTTQTPLGLLAVFGAGIASFLAPCVLPLVPGYLSFLAGTSLGKAPDEPVARWQVSRHALWFVAGPGALLPPPSPPRPRLPPAPRSLSTPFTPP